MIETNETTDRLSEIIDCLEDGGYEEEVELDIVHLLLLLGAYESVVEGLEGLLENAGREIERLNRRAASALV